MKTIFAKYNSERLPKYQIVTKIVEDNDKKRYALKEPLCEEAKEHIESVYKNYKLLRSTYDINLVKPTIVENGILFEMAEGRSLENILLDSIAQNDETSFQRYINKFLDFVNFAQFSVNSTSSLFILLANSILLSSPNVKSGNSLITKMQRLARGIIPK